MEEDNQEQQTIIQNQEMESLENPFNKLAPEVTALILSCLKDHIPSLMAAGGVCRLWRELVDWKQVKQLHLDFEHMRINNVSMACNKWPQALDTLLPKVKLTSLWVTLPYKKQDRQSADGLFFDISKSWPLSLLDSGAMVDSLVTKHHASFYSVTTANFQGCPSNTEFEYGCYLLKLCPSLSVLKLTLTVDRFPWSSLQGVLSGKSITSLSISLCEIGAESEHRLAQLCQVLTPGALKTLTIITNVYQDPEHRVESESVPTYGSYPDNIVLFCLDRFLSLLETNPYCVSALELLHFGARDLAVSQQFVGSVANLTNFAHLVHKVLPKLRSIKFNIPACDIAKWTQFRAALEMLANPLHPDVDVTLISSHCKIMGLFAKLTETAGRGLIHPTKEGFNHYPNVSGGKEPTIKFVYKRLCRTNLVVSCPCPVCGSEYEWMKGAVVKKLRATPTQGPELDWIFDTWIFPCQFDRLRADLVHEFPMVKVTSVKFDQLQAARIRVQGKNVFSYMCIHNTHRVGTLSVGCGITSE